MATVAYAPSGQIEPVHTTYNPTSIPPKKEKDFRRHPSPIKTQQGDVRRSRPRVPNTGHDPNKPPTFPTARSAFAARSPFCRPEARARNPRRTAGPQPISAQPTRKETPARDLSRESGGPFFWAFGGSFPVLNSGRFSPMGGGREAHPRTALRN
ncbi:uncharacterized protein TM35_000242100 [Trypanosoma theileri]|uniref:Uncharacterized protein n=1 Tax=Trypanosoma theileri TaxID=67003 RepID=A0A1X0NSH0_9TRYP|nr:uncharacterized protein TM35_000242100 [Trypanosoma theileri]ORC87060.1 hypothetical protein TM35_000242100 [Trypanosoma theileri]